MFNFILAIAIIFVCFVVVTIISFSMGNGKGAEAAVVPFILAIISLIIGVVYAILVSIAYFGKLY